MKPSVISVVATFAFSSLSAQAAQIEWLTGELRHRGAGCDPSSPGGAQMHVIAAGNDFSVVYTSLGQQFRDAARRPGTTISDCQFLIPALVPPGYYLSQMTQTTFLYGLTKSKGVSIRIVAGANFSAGNARTREDLSDLRRGIAPNEVFYPADQRVDAALETLSSTSQARIARPQRVRPGGRVESPNEVFNLFCASDRTRRMQYVSGVRVVVNKQNANAQFSVGVDGQDVSYSARFGLDTCQDSGPVVIPLPEDPNSKCKQVALVDNDMNRQVIQTLPVAGCTDAVPACGRALLSSYASSSSNYFECILDGKETIYQWDAPGYAFPPFGTGIDPATGLWR